MEDIEHHADVPEPVAVRPSQIRRIWDNPGTRIFVFIVLFILIYIALGAATQHVLDAILPKNRPHNPNSPLAVILSSLIPALSSLVVLWVMLRFAEHRRMSDAGFMMRGVFFETMAGYMIGSAMMCVSVGILTLLGVFHNLGPSPHFMLGVALIAYLCVGVFEESAFRGMFQRVLEYRYGSFVALIISAIIFGAAHLSNVFSLHLPIWQGLWGAFCIIVEAGILLGAGYIATRRLWLVIGIHWGWDFFESSVFGLPNDGVVDANTAMHSSLTGPFLLTGGKFGPEASIVFLAVCTIMGLLMLRVAIRSGNWKPAGEWQPASLPKSGDAPPVPAPI